MTKDDGQKRDCFPATMHSVLKGARRVAQLGTLATPLPFGFRADFAERTPAFGFRARKCAVLLALLLTTFLVAAAPLKENVKPTDFPCASMLWRLPR